MPSWAGRSGTRSVADGHSIDWMTGIGDAGAAIVSAPYELILLDLMLPDGRGLDFLKARRAARDATPVIILTARDQISDRIAGLNAGADDYLVKPFDLAELSARIGAVARRYAGNPNPQVEIGDLTIDLAQRADPAGRATDHPDGARMGAVRGLRAAPAAADVQGAAGGAALLLRRRGREQHHRGLYRPDPQEARPRHDRDRCAAWATGSASRQRATS